MSRVENGCEHGRWFYGGCAGCIEGLRRSIEEGAREHAEWGRRWWAERGTNGTPQRSK